MSTRAELGKLAGGVEISEPAAEPRALSVSSAMVRPEECQASQVPTCSTGMVGSDAPDGRLAIGDRYVDLRRPSEPEAGTRRGDLQAITLSTRGGDGCQRLYILTVSGMGDANVCWKRSKTSSGNVSMCGWTSGRR